MWSSVWPGSLCWDQQSPFSLWLSFRNDTCLKHSQESLRFSVRAEAVLDALTRHQSRAAGTDKNKLASEINYVMTAVNIFDMSSIRYYPLMAGQYSSQAEDECQHNFAAGCCNRIIRPLDTNDPWHIPYHQTTSPPSVSYLVWFNIVSVCSINEILSHCFN